MMMMYAGDVLHNRK